VPTAELTTEAPTGESQLISGDGNEVSSIGATPNGPLSLVTTNDGSGSSFGYVFNSVTDSVVKSLGSFNGLESSAALPNDQYGYLADGGLDSAGLWAVDLQSPYTLTSLSPPSGSGISAPIAVGVSACPGGSTVVVADANGNLDVLNVSGSPTAPSWSSVGLGGTPAGVTCYGGTAYVANEGLSEIQAVSLGGTPTVTSHATLSGAPVAVAVGFGQLYAVGGGSTLWTVPLGGSSASSSTTVGSSPVSVAVGPSDVYVANKASNSVSVLTPGGTLVSTISSLSLAGAVAVAPMTPSTSNALSAANELGLDNPAIGCTCADDESASELADEATLGDEAEIDSDLSESIGLDAMGGFPINTGTGNFTYALPAFNDPGLGTPLTFQLTYNSYASSGYLASSHTGTPDVGYGWEASPALTLVPNSPSTGDATVIQENGSQVNFVPPTTTSPFVCPTGYNALDPVATALCASWPVDAILLHNSGGTWTFDRFLPSYESFTFNSSGNLTAIADAFGNSTSVTSFSTGTVHGLSCPTSSCLLFYAPSTRYLLFEENTAGQVTEITDGLHQAALSYCTSNTSTCATGDLSSYGLSSASASDNNDTTTHTWSFTYDETSSLNAIATVTDPRGFEQVANTYDDASSSDSTFGWVATQTQALTATTNATTGFTYQGLGNSSSTGDTILTDPNGNKTFYGYLEGSLVEKITGYTTASAAASLYYRDANTLDVTTAVNPRGGATQYAYATDGSGRVTSVTDGVGNTLSMAYSSSITLSGNINTAYYEPIWLGNAAQTSSLCDTYASSGNGERTARTRYSTYVSSANCGQSGGQVTDYYYNSVGQLTGVDDPLGKGNVYVYSATPGDLTQSWVVPNYSADVSSLSASNTEDETTYTHDSVGRQTTVDSPNGNAGTPANYTTTTNDFNAFDEPTLITDPPVSGVSATDIKTYDADGDLLTDSVDDNESPAVTNETTYTYDEADRQLTQTDGSGTSAAATQTWGYDGDNNVTSYENANGSAETTTYAFGDPAYPQAATQRTLPVPVSGGTAPVYAYTYDLAGNQASSADPDSNTITMGYDADNRLCYEYTGSTAGDSCASPPSGTGAISFTYTADGQRASMTDGTGTTTYTYNSLGEATQVVDGAGKKVTYEYDADGEVTCIGYPIGGSHLCPASGVASGSYLLAYTYGEDVGQITSMKDWQSNTSTFTYDADGDVTGVDYPSTYQETIGYDHNDVVTSEEWYNTGTMSGVTDSYTNDSVGRQLTKDLWGAIGNDKGPDQTYDPLNRVTSGYNINNSNFDTYTYNLNGEVATAAPAENGGSTTDYSYNYDDELTSSSVAGTTTGTYAYNGDGQRCMYYGGSVSGLTCASTPSGANSYGWDAYGNMCWTAGTPSNAACSAPPSGAEVYTYNGDGMRMTEKSTPGGALEHFTYDTVSTPSLPLLLADGANAYIYGPSALGAGTTPPLDAIALSGGTNYPQESTPQGIQVDTNSSDWSLTLYDTYGSKSVGDPFCYGTCPEYPMPLSFENGYQDNNQTPYLVYTDNRYYDPTTEQFISMDPAVNTTHQPYEFANDDPINESDPSGLECGPEGPGAPDGEAGEAANIGIGGEAAQYDINELAQLTYQHIGEGDIPGRPSLDEIDAALRNGVGERLAGQNAVQFEYNGVRVIINETVPTRSTAYYPGG